MEHISFASVSPGHTSSAPASPAILANDSTASAGDRLLRVHPEVSSRAHARTRGATHPLQPPLGRSLARGLVPESQSRWAASDPSGEGPLEAGLLHRHTAMRVVA
jgi:hypothetical protein